MVKEISVRHWSKFDFKNVSPNSPELLKTTLRDVTLSNLLQSLKGKSRQLYTSKSWLLIACDQNRFQRISVDWWGRHTTSAARYLFGQSKSGNLIGDSFFLKLSTELQRENVTSKNRWLNYIKKLFKNLPADFLFSPYNCECSLAPSSPVETKVRRSRFSKSWMLSRFRVYNAWKATTFSISKRQ